MGSLLNRADVLIVDTETTGLYWPEIVDIAIIETRGYRRMNRLVLPEKMEIETDAIGVHRIRMDKLREEGTPKFSAMAPRLQQIVGGATDILIYNADFDIAAVRVSLENNGVPADMGTMIADKSRCFMLDYAFLAGVCTIIGNAGPGTNWLMRHAGRVSPVPAHSAPWLIAKWSSA